jgi:hypothetical protein
MEIRFRRPVDPAVLNALAGVKVTATDGPRRALEVTGEIGPVLNVTSRHDPLDLTSRPAGLMSCSWTSTAGRRRQR